MSNLFGTEASLNQSKRPVLAQKSTTGKDGTGRDLGKRTHKRVNRRHVSVRTVQDGVATFAILSGTLQPFFDHIHQFRQTSAFFRISLTTSSFSRWMRGAEIGASTIPVHSAQHGFFREVGVCESAGVSNLFCGRSGIAEIISSWTIWESRFASVWARSPTVSSCRHEWRAGGANRSGTAKLLHDLDRRKPSSWHTRSREI